MSKINLGDIVKSKKHNIKGMVIAINYHKDNQQNVVAIQTKVSEKEPDKLPKLVWIKPHWLTVVIKNKDPHKLPNIKLGDLYEDMVTGFQGIAYSFTIHITGCNNVEIQPPSRDGVKLEEDEWIAENHLKPIDKMRSVKKDESKTG